MQSFDGLKILPLLLGLAAAPAAFAHPYEGMPRETPLAFVLHTTDDGRPIYTNIPKKCFSNKRLSCIYLHPVIGGSGALKQPGTDTTRDRNF